MMLHSSEVKFHAQYYLNYENLRLSFFSRKNGCKKSRKNGKVTNNLADFHASNVLKISEHKQLGYFAVFH